jgi:hypothetical protein
MTKYPQQRKDRGMSSEEVFVQRFATLFTHYRHALTLESVGENGSELQELSDLPIVELDRMVSAARLALLEIETNARENDDGRQYYSKMGRTRRRGRNHRASA